MVRNTLLWVAAALTALGLLAPHGYAQVGTAYGSGQTTPSYSIRLGPLDVAPMGLTCITGATVAPCGIPGSPLVVTGGTGGGGSGGSAPSGTAGTAATGTGAASPVYDALTGKGLLTAGTALPAGTNALGTVGVTALPSLPTGGNTIGTVNIGTQSVPSGAATSGNQATQITAEQAIAGAVRTNDTATSRAQTHDDQLAGVSTAAAQATGNGSLATIATNTGAGATSANQTTQITAEQTTATAQGVAGPGTNPGTGILGWLSGTYARLASLLTVAQPDVRATGTLAAATVGATYVVPVTNGQNIVGFGITGLTASGAVLATQISADGTNWQAVNNNSPGGGNVASPVTADGAVKVNAGGHQAVRLIVTTVGTGTITVASNASVATGSVALSSPIPAGTNQIGTVSGSSVGGYTAGSGYVTPTLASTAAYAAGQTVGGVLTFPAITRAGATTGSVTKALVFFADTQTPALDLLLFASAPTSTVTDHTALSLSAVDNAKATTVIHVTDCTAMGTPTLCQAADIHREFVLPTVGAPIYGVLVARSAFTPASTTDVAVAIVGVSD